MARSDGPMALALMWAMTAIGIVFVMLRIYTRHFIIRSFGADDVAYITAGIFLLLYTAFLQVSLQYGFGQSIQEIADLGKIALAIKWEMVGQTFAVLGMAITKVSLGLFLLRLVVITWHRIAIWTVMITLCICSVLTAIMLWMQCTPVEGIYDPRVKPTANCNIQITPFAILLGAWCIMADFFFAIFPGIVIWKLNMKRKEKIIITSSMSLGVFAGAAGIIRTYEVAVGFTANYTQDTVPLIIWSAVEMAVTMVCIGIPILRPLYRRVFLGYILPSGEEGSYQKQGEGSDQHGTPLRTIGQASSRGNGQNQKLGLGSHTITEIQTANYNNSDEYILTKNPDGDSGMGAQGTNGGIRVKDDVRVEWN